MLQKKLRNVLGLLFMGSFLIGAASAPKTGSEDKIVDCESTREYVTSLEYLRGKKEYAIAEADARKLADKISLGCTGAASRFIRVMNVLVGTGLTAKDALDTGLAFSSKSDEMVKTFLTVFAYAFSGEGADLDLPAAHRMARAATLEYDGDSEIFRDDFARLIRFCVGEEGLGLPRPQCAQFALRVAKLGTSMRGTVYRDFKSSYEFAKSESGPGMTSADALSIAEWIVIRGNEADDNFSKAYKYASNAGGLALSRSDSIQFAKTLADRSTLKMP